MGPIKKPAPNKLVIEKPVVKKPAPKKPVRKIKRRPSFDIARNFIEMNFAVLLGPELTPKEAKKAQKKSVNRNVAPLARNIACAGLLFQVWL